MCNRLLYTSAIRENLLNETELKWILTLLMNLKSAGNVRSRQSERTNAYSPSLAAFS